MNAPLLRFITAGSVDDGKSTLIGRLLYDSKTLLTDQLAKLDQAQANGETPDFASLTDGLAAEREQGITIDVAYRYFATAKRKFIIADTPGHEQYTRNMVTGASTADAAIVLIDATRIDFSNTEPSLLPQTKRHTAILKLLGCQNIIIAINKLDLLAFDENKYQIIVSCYQNLTKQIGLQANLHFLPISALNGDNIVHISQHTPWYQGLALLPLLENLPASYHQYPNQTAHFPVQRVARQDGSSNDDFRGYQGRLEAGQLKVGETIKVLPNGQHAQISQIHTPQGPVKNAQAGEILTLTLDKDIDISRGNSIVSINSNTTPIQQFQAALCWFDETPLNLKRKYLLKHTSQTTAVKINEINYVWDVNTLSKVQSVHELKLNDIGTVTIKTQQPINATLYHENAALGAFILIDESTNHTIAAGMIRSENATFDFEI